MEGTVRWSLKVSKETDEALRTYLGQRGGRRGELSRFIEEAVRARLVETVQGGKSRNKPAVGASGREGFARTAAAIRSRAKALTRSQVKKLAAEAVAFARKAR